MAAGVLLVNASISGFPNSAAVGALLLTDDDIEEMAISSDDGALSGRQDGTPHKWQGASMPFDRAPTYSNVSEPGGHLPQGQNYVGSLLSPKLSQSARREHINNLLRGSNWPDHIDRAETKRREMIVSEGALAHVITVEDHGTFKSMDAQINMDIDAMVQPTSDGKKYVREFNHTSGVELGYAPHNVSCKLKMKLKTCRDKHGIFSWKRMFQEFARVIDREMKGMVDNAAQIFVSLSFQEFFAGTERQADGLSWKRKFTPPSVDDLSMLISFLKTSIV